MEPNYCDDGKEISEIDCVASLKKDRTPVYDRGPVRKEKLKDYLLQGLSQVQPQQTGSQASRRWKKRARSPERFRRCPHSAEPAFGQL